MRRLSVVSVFLGVGTLFVLSAGCGGPTAADVGVDAPADRGTGDAFDVAPGDGDLDAPPTDVAMDATSDAGCMPGRINCGGRCVNLVDDPMNCGGCDVRCDMGAACMGGLCVTTCPMGQTACGTPARCVNLQTDTNHCGMCGTACGAARSCVSGTCMSTCMAPLTPCGSGATMVCANLQTDGMNCGACGMVCAAGRSCSMGACACAAGQTDCMGRCVDTQRDDRNCGGCGMACPAGNVCVMARCQVSCPTGQTNCSGMCVNLTNDNANCGACGRGCTGGQTCMSSMCACAAGLTSCAGSCVNVTNDNANCGACGRVCSGGQVCTGGACACPTGQMTCGGRCIDPQTDNSNCGGCGRACMGGQSCSAGVCVCPAGQTFCGGRCVNTQSDNANCGMCGRACTTGTSCMAGVCNCPPGETLCGTTCVNLRTSDANCGACGTVCMGGQACAAGVCACPVGQTFCGGRCTDTRSDNANCGMCGTACMSGSSCISSMCSSLPPPNDTRATAIRIDTSMPSVTLTTNTTAARNDTMGNCGGACSMGNDVFYAFALAVPEIVYVDSVGSTFDTTLFLQDMAGTNLVDPMIPTGAVCNDNGGIGCMTGMQSQILARLDAGTYYLVLSGCGAGSATIHFQHLPVGNGPATRIFPNVGMGTQIVSGTTSGVGRITSTCCSDGPENTYFFMTCPAFASDSFNATTCGGAAWNTELDQRSAVRTPLSVCNDDACAQRSLVTSTLPAGAGLHTLYLDGCTGGAGAYSVGMTFGACPVGQSLCTGRCINTQSDNSNCGSCGNVCALGLTCQAGACRPFNNECANAQPVTLSATGTTTFTGNTSLATGSANSCDAAGADLWYRFTLATRELVYVDSFGSAFDTNVGITASCMTMPTNCNDDSCATTQSQLAVELAAGTYYLVVDGRGGATGAFTVHIQHLPISGTSLGTLPAGAYSVSGDTTGATNTPGTCGGAGDRFYQWLSCPGYLGGTFTASTCAAASYDTVLQLRNGDGFGGGCNDDACPMTRSNLMAMVGRGAGVHVLYADGWNTSVGTYTIVGSRP